MQDQTHRDRSGGPVLCIFTEYGEYSWFIKFQEVTVFSSFFKDGGPGHLPPHPLCGPKQD